MTENALKPLIGVITQPIKLQHWHKLPATRKACKSRVVYQFLKPMERVVCYCTAGRIRSRFRWSEKSTISFPFWLNEKYIKLQVVDCNPLEFLLIKAVGLHPYFLEQWNHSYKPRALDLTANKKTTVRLNQSRISYGTFKEAHNSF